MYCKGGGFTFINNGYLICEKCDGYYKLQDNESPDDFESCQCGGKLIHKSNYQYLPLDQIEDINKDEIQRRKSKEGKLFVKSENLNEKTSERESITIGKTFTEIKAEQYQKKERKTTKKTLDRKRKKSPSKNKYTYIKKNPYYGKIAIIGIIGLFIGSFLFGILIGILILICILVIGVLASPERTEKYKVLQESYGPYQHKNPLKTPPVKSYIHHQSDKKRNSWIKGIEGENKVLDQLNTLPKNYFVFHDVTLPQGKGNIDHIVIGPTGLFVIETKNYSGNYRIEGNQWYYLKNHKYNEIKKDPGKQLIRNIIDLKSFLESKGIKKSKVYANGIIALVQNNYSIMREPDNYKILTPIMIPEYMLNHHRKENRKTLAKIAEEIEPYCTEITFVRKK